jgi:hypothetical protein
MTTSSHLCTVQPATLTLRQGCQNPWIQKFRNVIGSMPSPLPRHQSGCSLSSSCSQTCPSCCAWELPPVSMRTAASVTQQRIPTGQPVAQYSAGLFYHYHRHILILHGKQELHNMPLSSVGANSIPYQWRK